MTEVHLLSGEWSARISPAGASLLELSYRSEQIVAGNWPEAVEWFAGCTLAPWVNRLADGTWSDESGQLHRAEINDSQTNSANHGLVFNRKFSIESQDNNSVTLTTTCFDQEAYPFDVQLTVTYALHDDRLHVNLVAENAGDVAVPFAFGSHPYLVVEDSSKLTVAAKSRIEIDSRMMPVGEVSVPGGKFVIFPAQKSDYTDACFTSLAVENGYIETTLTRPKLHSEVVLNQSADLNYLQVFTLQGGYAGHPALLALEPQSAPANALNNPNTDSVLRPKQKRISEWSIGLRNSNHG